MSEASREQDNNSNLRCVANPNYGTWLLRDCGGDGNKFDAATAAVRPITPDGGGSFCAGRRPSGAHTAAVECPLLAQSRLLDAIHQCLLLGVKRTSGRRTSMSAFDPKRTFDPGDCCHAKCRSDPFRRSGNPAVIAFYSA